MERNYKIQRHGKVTVVFKIAEFKCHEICAPQNREINVSREFRVIGVSLDILIN